MSNEKSTREVKTIISNVHNACFRSAVQVAHALHLVYNIHVSDCAGVIKLSTADAVSFYDRKYIGVRSVKGEVKVMLSAQSAPMRDTISIWLKFQV